MIPPYWDQAKRTLARRDPILRRLIKTHSKTGLRRRGQPFEVLARAIVGQQLSVKAAQTVWNRCAAQVPSLQAGDLLACDLTNLRACGLSQRKAEYLHDLALHFTTGRIEPATWQSLEDEALIAQLMQVKGVGRWTAEMLLLFYELRPDVLPLADLGLRRALTLLYGDGEPLTVDAMSELAQRWRPWRSVATWYLWRSLDPIPVEY